MLKTIESTETILNTNDKSTVKLEHVKQIIEFAKNFADKYHQFKEKDMIFMKMKKYNIVRNGGSISPILQEHSEGRK